MVLGRKKDRKDNFTGVWELMDRWLNEGVLIAGAEDLYVLDEVWKWWLREGTKPRARPSPGVVTPWLYHGALRLGSLICAGKEQICIEI